MRPQRPGKRYNCANGMPAPIGGHLWMGGLARQKIAAPDCRI
jgi:hypothetical protein